MQLAARLAKHNQKNTAAETSDNAAEGTLPCDKESEPVHQIEQPPERPRNPFADNEYDGDEGIDSDDDDDPAAPPPGSGMWNNRGGWWREVLQRGGKSSDMKGVNESADNDSNSIGDEDETGSPGAEDDEEFGEFAMPEISTGESSGDGGATLVKELEEGSEESDKEPEKVILKPLPVHPPTTKTGFSSLWPFGGEKKDEEEKLAEEKEIASEEGIKKTMEAKRRTNIEDPEEDEVVV